MTSYIKNEIELFEEELKKIISSSNNFLNEDIYNFIFSSAKRLRIRFIFLFAKILKINDNKVFDIALATELFHSASLVHDDIIDCDKLRRKIPTFNYKYNSKIAVLVGDMLLSLALKSLANTNNVILKIFSNRIFKTLEGEIEQNNSNNSIPTFENYINKTFNKTGNLFLAGVESLFELDKTNIEQKENILNFLKNYSIAFQINNDIKNFKIDNSDFKNGNYTLPMIYLKLENGSIDDIEKYSSLAYQKVVEYKNIALSFLNKLEKSKYIDEIIDLTEKSLGKI